LPKPFGPLLAAVELGVFIVMPVVREIKYWFSRGGDIVKTRRSKVWILVFSLFVLMSIVPWDGRLSSQALYRPVKLAIFTAPGDAQLIELSVKDGEQVVAGQPLLFLQSDDLAFQLKAEQAKQVAATWQLSATGIDQKRRENMGVIIADQQRANTRVNSLQEELSNYLIETPQSGIVSIASPDLKVGDWVGKNSPLIELYDVSSREVVTYVEEHDLPRIHVGQKALFIAEQSMLKAIDVVVSRVDSDATRQLPEGVLASTMGGDILVRQAKDQWVPERSIYRVILKPMHNSEILPVNYSRGDVVIYADAESWLGKYAMNIAAVLRREVGF